MAFDHFAPRLRSAPFVGYSANPELDATRHEDRQDFYAQEQEQYSAAVALEEQRLAALALKEAESGDYDKLWDATGHNNTDHEVMVALHACARGLPGSQEAAKMVMQLLANTYGEVNAEVRQ